MLDLTCANLMMFCLFDFLKANPLEPVTEDDSNQVDEKPVKEKSPPPVPSKSSRRDIKIYLPHLDLSDVVGDFEATLRHSSKSSPKVEQPDHKPITIGKRLF